MQTRHIDYEDLLEVSLRPTQEQMYVCIGIKNITNQTNQINIETGELKPTNGHRTSKRHSNETEIHTHTPINIPNKIMWSKIYLMKNAKELRFLDILHKWVFLLHECV